MKFNKLVVIAILALFAMACGDTTTVNTPPKPSPAASPTATVETTPDPMVTAREFFTDNCETCHQENGEGGRVKIEGKRLNVPALTKGHALSHSDDEFRKQISNGGEGMPAFKNKANADDINNLIRFIRKTFQSGANAKKADMPDKMPMDIPKH